MVQVSYYNKIPKYIARQVFLTCRFEWPNLNLDSSEQKFLASSGARNHLNLRGADAYTDLLYVIT